MNFGELKTSVIEDTHRPDLTSLVPRFIREGEGMLRRELIAHILTTTMTDIDRVSAGSPIYNLPDRILILRQVRPEGQQLGLSRVALDAINGYAVTNRVHSYAEPGDNTIELRGNPPTGAEFTINYFGMPASLVADADTNDLLEDHETIYKTAAMFYLYQHTQDRELASDALEVFNGVMESLNEQVSRKIGGAKITPSYNFHGGSSY